MNVLRATKLYAYNQSELYILCHAFLLQPKKIRRKKKGRMTSTYRFLHWNALITLLSHEPRLVGAWERPGSFFFWNNRMMIKLLPVNDRCCYWALTMCQTLDGALPIYYPVSIHSWLLVEAGFWGLGMRHLTGHTMSPPGTPTQRPFTRALSDLNYASTSQGEGGW